MCFLCTYFVFSGILMVLLIYLLSYICSQVLPEVFDEHFYTGNNMLYLTGNDRDRYKVEISRDKGRWLLRDKEWIDFVKSNVPANATDIHFIRQGDDSYYVTVYKEDGSECYGYDRKLKGAIFFRCLVEFNHGMQVNSINKNMQQMLFWL